MKKVKIELTPGELMLVTTALFEYGQICADGAYKMATTPNGAVEMLDKKDAGWADSKAYTRVNDKIQKQIRAAE